MKDVLVLYTFCVYIGRHNRADLIKCLNILYNSLNKIKSKYKLIVYSNLKIEHNLPNLEVKKYYDNGTVKMYHDPWLNLSFNKINIFKDLSEEIQAQPIWIDLDTVITGDISYLKNIDNCFIENGGNCETPNPLFNNNNSITVPRKSYIQGNFWKINKKLQSECIECAKQLMSKKMTPRYDLQDIYSYLYVYNKNEKGNSVNILGNNYKTQTINGLAVWSEHGHSHANKEGLQNLFQENGKLYSKFYPNKNIDILSLTFNTLKKIWDLDKFKQIIK